VGSVPHGVGRVGDSMGSLDVGGWKKGMLQKNLRIFRSDGSPKMFLSRYLSKTGVTIFCQIKKPGSWSLLPFSSSDNYFSPRHLLLG
jgi:hypothetical protein